jgi:hypothetical protein
VLRAPIVPAEFGAAGPPDRVRWAPSGGRLRQIGQKESVSQRIAFISA